MLSQLGYVSQVISIRVCQLGYVSYDISDQVLSVRLCYLCYVLVSFCQLDYVMLVKLCYLGYANQVMLIGLHYLGCASQITSGRICCQAQPSSSSSWAEFSLISKLSSHPTRPDQTRQEQFFLGNVSTCDECNSATIKLSQAQAMLKGFQPYF